MPLASYEEWRARIGSCWCALGRPFKTSKSPGDYRSFAALSGSARLQAVYALMVMVLALIRTVVFVRGVNGCVNECQRQIKTNVCPRRVLMILIVLLQATSFIQSSLLLRCGDIESNPGPGIYPDLDYDDINNSTVLTVEDDFREVYREVIGIQSNYYQFGIELGLPLREMDAVQNAFRQDIPRAFMEVLQIFLKHRYNIEKYGPPTWQKLVEAVDSPAGGNNHALAKKIAENHPINKGDQITEYHPSAPEETPVGETTNVMVETSANRPKGSRVLIQRCRDTMTAYYQRQVDDRAWPPVKSTNFVNLALIGNQTSWRRTVQKSVDEIIGNKTTASYLNMVDDNCIGTFTLLEGRPGSGKTVLMNKISCDWAKGEILKSSLLIFIPLRKLREEPDRKLATLLRVACSALPQSDINELVSHINKTQGKGIVFAFDGFDEYVPYHYRKKVVKRTASSRRSTPSREEWRWYDIFRWKRKPEYIIEILEDVFELLNGNSLTKSTVFVTSRPAACNDIREYAKKRIEVLGFLKPQIIEYVNYYFSNDKPKAQQLVAHLEHHPNLMNIAYLPLHCAMLAFLFEDDTFPLPETETEFYKHFVLSTVLRSLRRQEGSITTTITSLDQLPQREKTIFDKVCQLAFNATVQSKQVFTSADIESILPGTDSGHARKDVSDLGLIVTDHYFMRFGLDDTYTFLHLTFQEYLGAIYIAELSEAERMQIIEIYKYKENLSVVWRFLCGMMDFSQINTMVTFESIMKAIKNKLEELQCCFETQHSSPCSYIINSSNGRLKFSSSNFTPSDCTAIGYTISKSDFQSMIYLIFDKCSFSTEGATSMFQKIGDHPLSLTISLGGDSADDIGAQALVGDLKHCANLKALNFSNNRIGDAGAQALSDLLKHCASIKELNLSNNSIGDAGMQALVESIKHCPMEKLNFGYNQIRFGTTLADCLKHCAYIKELDLQSNHIGSGVGVQIIAANLKHCADLNKLDLTNNGIEDAGIQVLFEGIKHCPSMEKLNLGHNRIQFGTTLADCLKHCAYIKELDLTNNGIEDAGIQVLFEGIKHCPSMEKLNFGYNCIRFGTTLADCLKHCAYIKELDLQSNHIGSGVGVQIIAANLKHCADLNKLDLTNNRIGDAGIQVLFEGIKHCSIKELKLDYNQLSDDIVPLLIEVIQTFKNLERLSLGSNNFTASGVNRIELAKLTAPRNVTVSINTPFIISRRNAIRS